MDIKYKKGTPWNRAPTQKMKQFKEETGRNAIYRGKITGGFEYWMYWRKSKSTKPKSKPTKKPIKKPVTKKPIKQPSKRAKSKEEIMNRLVKIQEKYKNDPKKFQKDPEFIKLSQLLGRTRRKIIKLQTVKEVKEIKEPIKSKIQPRISTKKPKIKVIIHLPYGKSEDLLLTINFMSSRVKNQSKKEIQNIIDDEWSEKYMYNPEGYVHFKHLTFAKDGDIYLKYEVTSVSYDNKQDLELMFNDLAKIIYNNSKYIPTGIRVTAHYSENWIKKYKKIKDKIDSLSPYDRIIIKELKYNDTHTKLALVRELKRKYPKSNFSMVTFSRYSSNLIRKKYIEYTGLTTGGMGRIKLTKDGKLIKELLMWR